MDTWVCFETSLSPYLQLNLPMHVLVINVVTKLFRTVLGAGSLLFLSLLVVHTLMYKELKIQGPWVLQIQGQRRDASFNNTWYWFYMPFSVDANNFMNLYVFNIMLVTLSDFKVVVLYLTSAHLFFFSVNSLIAQRSEKFLVTWPHVSRN